MWFLFSIVFVILYVIHPFVCLVAIVLTIIFLLIKSDIRRKGENWQIQFIDQYKFSNGFLLKHASKHTELSDSQRGMVLDGLRQYFRMCQKSPSSMVSMPSLAVDEAWHEFILFTHEYKEFCDKAFGRFLHHTPDEAMESKQIVQVAIHNAWQLACKDENIQIKSPNRLPKIFSIDASLAIVGGHTYSLKDFKNIPNSDENVKDYDNGGGWGCGCGGCGS